MVLTFSKKALLVASVLLLVACSSGENAGGEINPQAPIEGGTPGDFDYSQGRVDQVPGMTPRYVPQKSGYKPTAI